MGIGALWDRIRRTTATDRFVGWLGRVNGVADPLPITPLTSYVSIRAMSARLDVIRKWKSYHHVSIVSSIDWQHELDGMQTTSTVVSPDSFRNLDETVSDRIALNGIDLLRTVPYCGELKIEAGLFSVREADLVAPILDFLVDLADTTGFGQALPARNYASILNRASDILFGGDKTSELIIGLEQQFRGDELKKGYLLITDSPKKDFAIQSIRVDPGDMKLVDTARKPITSVNYILLRIDSPLSRYDFATLPGITERRQAINAAFRLRRQQEVEDLIDELARFCRTLPDLLPRDAEEYVRQVKARYSEKEGDLIAGEIEPTGGLLDGIDPFRDVSADPLRGAPPPPEQIPDEAADPKPTSM